MNLAGYEQLQHSHGSYMATGPVRMQRISQENERDISES